MRAIVIGGGIAGLATGVALRKVGIEATVFEQADSVREVGAGLSLWSNAVRMLHWLELPPSGARPIEEGITYDQRGRVLQRESLRAIHQRLGFASVCMERPALVDLLASKASVVTGARLKFWEHDAQGVTAHFENGREERGDFLVGADGIHSRVREILLGVSRPRFAGYTTWRALVDMPWERRTLVLGRGSQVGIFPCTATRTYWFATTNIPVPGARVPSPREFFRGWTDVWLDVLRRTPDEAILRNDVYDRPPVPSWGRGRVTMLGDSIHATTPNLGQGACQALESAVALALELARGGPLVESLRRFEAHRRPRTASITRTSWRFGQLMQLENPLLVALRNWLMSRELFIARSLGVLEKLLAGGP